MEQISESIKKIDNVTTFKRVVLIPELLSRSSHWRCSVRKVLWNFSKFAGKHLCQTLLKKRLFYSCFPVNFAKFRRTPFLQNTSGRLLQSGFLWNSTKCTEKYMHWSLIRPPACNLIKKETPARVFSCRNFTHVQI